MKNIYLNQPITRVAHVQNVTTRKSHLQAHPMCLSFYRAAVTDRY